MMTQAESAEDILTDSLALFGGESAGDDHHHIRYGPLVLSVACKVGKAATLMADHLFSPALLLAERIERGLVPAQGSKVIELGAGCALPSLLMSTLPQPPSLIVVTDYPDADILGNLKENVDRNRQCFKNMCKVVCRGYEWGTNVAPLMDLLPDNDCHPAGYDIVIMSDLLHFHSSHDVLVNSIISLLSKSHTSRVYLAAGKYTARHVCDNFVRVAEKAGVILEEGQLEVDQSDARWLGTMTVSGLNEEDLAIRKGMCRWWVGRWRDI